MSFPPGFPMHFSAHQPQQQLVIAEPLNLRCDHESHSQSSSCAKRSRQIAVFRGGLPCLASVSWGLGEVRCIHSNFPRGSLKLRSPSNRFNSVNSTLHASSRMCCRGSLSRTQPRATGVKRGSALAKRRPPPEARIPPRLAVVLKRFSRPRSVVGHRAIIKSAE